uniref:MATH domain-containing protein n=1 Tax=Bursaphelenchus xylophilus TaxID=6326 RepID=A0A1I7S0P6_BURXY
MKMFEAIVLIIGHQFSHSDDKFLENPSKMFCESKFLNFCLPNVVLDLSCGWIEVLTTDELHRFWRSERCQPNHNGFFGRLWAGMLMIKKRNLSEGEICIKSKLGIYAPATGTAAVEEAGVFADAGWVREDISEEFRCTRIEINR